MPDPCAAGMEARAWQSAATLCLGVTEAGAGGGTADACIPPPVPMAFTVHVDNLEVGTPATGLLLLFLCVFSG